MRRLGAGSRIVADLVVVFQAVDELQRVRRAMADVADAVRLIEPPPQVADLVPPYLVVCDPARPALYEAIQAGAVIAGQVWHREPLPDALEDLGPPAAAGADAVGRVSIAFVAPCIAEDDHLRLTVQIERDVSGVFPYLNALLPHATYNPKGPTFTFMDGPRLVNLFPHRAVIARVREMHDAWRTITHLVRTINDAWNRRDSIEPLYERRVQISVLEVFSRLPQTNCRACGERTCLAFAAKLLQGEQRIENCTPVFGGDREHLKDALLDIVAGLGV
jgi:ArsR family metal-binding transcriptional regulator